MMMKLLKTRDASNKSEDDKSMVGTSRRSIVFEGQRNGIRFRCTFVPRGFVLRLLQAFVYPRRGSMLSFETELLMRPSLVNSISESIFF